MVTRNMPGEVRCVLLAGHRGRTFSRSIWLSSWASFIHRCLRFHMNDIMATPIVDSS